MFTATLDNILGLFLNNNNNKHDDHLRVTAKDNGNDGITFLSSNNTVINVTVKGNVVDDINIIGHTKNRLLWHSESGQGQCRAPQKRTRDYWNRIENKRLQQPA